jgi:hypothetical protein
MKSLESLLFCSSYVQDSRNIGSFHFLTKSNFPFSVLCTRSDPVPGWIDNHYGATGVVVGVGLGIIRTLHINAKTIGDMVPCDMAVSALVAAAWHIQERRRYKTEHS